MFQSWSKQSGNKGHCCARNAVTTFRSWKVWPCSQNFWRLSPDSGDSTSQLYCNISAASSQFKIIVFKNVMSCSMTQYYSLCSHQCKNLIFNCDVHLFTPSVCFVHFSHNTVTLLHLQRFSGVLRNFFRRGGFNKFSWGQRTETMGIWGAVGQREWGSGGGQ